MNRKMEEGRWKMGVRKECLIFYHPTSIVRRGLRGVGS